MTILFDRHIVVAVGLPGEQGRSWKDLKFTFSVTKTKGKRPNKATVDIYNLSADSRNWCAREGSTIVVRAGYEENPPIILIGDISMVTHERSGKDMVTKIEAGDGESAYQLGRVNRSWKAGSTNKDVLKGAAAAAGVGIGHVADIDEIAHTGGYTATGLVRDVLDDICEGVDAEWSIQDNELQIVKRNHGTNQAALKVSSTLGNLIGAPKRKTGKGRNPRRTRGVKFTTLLNPWIRPGRYIQLESREINGFFLVRSVTHSGASFEGTWYSEIEATDTAPRSGGQLKNTQDESTMDIQPGVAYWTGTGVSAIGQFLRQTDE